MALISVLLLLAQQSQVLHRITFHCQVNCLFRYKLYVVSLPPLFVFTLQTQKGQHWTVCRLNVVVVWYANEAILNSSSFFSMRFGFMLHRLVPRGNTNTKPCGTHNIPYYNIWYRIYKKTYRGRLEVRQNDRKRVRSNCIFWISRGKWRLSRRGVYIYPLCKSCTYSGSQLLIGKLLCNDLSHGSRLRLCGKMAWHSLR